MHIFWKYMNIYVPNLWGGGHIDFGTDPVGVGLGVSMTLSCLHNILCTSSWILNQIFVDI